jgi:hypothetical protein
MLKTIFITFLSLLGLFSSGSDQLFTETKQNSRQNDTGTLEKMLVANGSVSMDLDLKRLNGTRLSKLRFDTENDAFFKIIVFNDELRGPLPGSMKIIPQSSANLPAKLNASYLRLVIESISFGGQYDLVVRDGETGFVFFNIEGHEYEYEPNERLFSVKNGRLLMSNELAAEIGRPQDAGAVVGKISISATMRAIEITQVVDGEVTSAVMPAQAIPNAGSKPGPDVVVGDLSGLAHFGTSSGTQVGLAVATDSCNFGVEPLNWFALPANDHPVIPQNLYRMSGGATNDERFEQIGQSHVKHGFTALQQNLCGLGCASHPNGTRLGSGCSDPYSASLNAGPNLGSRAWINPFNGAFPRGDSATPPNNHGGHTHTGTSHRILTEVNDLNTALNAGATYYAEASYVTPHEYAWCQANPGQCNMYNNTSYRRYNVSGTTCSPGSSGCYSFSAAGSTVRERPAISTWPGSTQVQINPDPGNDGVAVVGYKVTNPSPGVWHYEYAVYNENLDRAIQSLGIPLGAGVTLNNIGFHAPPQHPGWSADGTVGSSGFSNAPWTQTQTAGAMTWSSETFAQNQNANAIRWGTLYNFRFDSNTAPGNALATIGFFKTGAPITVGILAPGGTGPGPTPTPTPTPAPTPTPTPTPNPGICTPTLTITETRPGGIAQFDAISAGPGSVTADVINSGSGLQGFSVVSATNAVINIPAFPLGTFSPVTTTFTVPNTSQPVDFTLRATTRFSGVLIRGQCTGGPPTPTPGRIIIDKVTNPSGNLTNFEYDPTWGPNFFLADATTPNDSGPLTPGGQYQLVELVPAGWTLTAMSCSIADSLPLGDSAFSPTVVPVIGPGQGAISILLGAGDTVSCVFTNTQAGGPTPTPTPTATPTPTPTPTPSPTPTPTPGGVCTPVLTVTETRPGGLGQFDAITAGAGSVTVDPVNFGNGLQGYTLDSATNAVVSIPAFTPGTFNPVTATFTRPNAGQPVDFTLRATSRFSGVLIRAQCGAPSAEPSFSMNAPDLSFWLPRANGLQVLRLFEVGRREVFVTTSE